MSRVRAASLLAIWVAVVVAASTGAWVVIRGAGSDVAATPPVPATTSSSVGSSAPSTMRPARPSSRPSARPSTRPSARPSVRPTAPATPSSAPPQPSASRTSTAPPPEPSPAVRRTWRGQAGELTVSCTGSSARFVSAVPSSGWRVDVEDRGPSRVRVAFETRERETRVSARCSGGQPSFAVTADD